MNDKNPFDDVPVIYSYTRQQAIEDGVLVDLTDWAKETGFCIPVACTSLVWHEYIVPPHGTRELGQSERGRAHDLIWMLYLAIKCGTAPCDSDGNAVTGASTRLDFEVVFLQSPHRHKTVTLKATCGPGDDGEPVVTIMLLHED